MSACSSGISKHQKYSRKHPPKNKVNIEQNTPHAKSLKKRTKKYKKRTKKYKKRTKKYKNRTKKYKKQTKTLLSPSYSDQLLLPTIIHPIDGTLMVLVDPSADQTSQFNPEESLTSISNTSNAQKKIKKFYIDHTEVTLSQYKKTNPSHDQTHITGKACPLCPAMSVDWINAEKHCRIIGKRLPTEAEWELAAGGPLKKAGPWNIKSKKSFANLVGEKDGFLSAAPVGSFPLGASPYGTLDMIGNVWEWVDTPHSPLPKNIKPNKSKNFRIAKGGGWTSTPSLATINHRNVVSEDIKNPTFGFRCAKSKS